MTAGSEAPPSVEPGGNERALEALAACARELVCDGSPSAALSALVRTVAEATRTPLVVARTAREPGADLVARAVHSSSSALAAELEGSRLPAADAPEEEADLDLTSDGPAVLRRTGARAHTSRALVLPIAAENVPIATLELFHEGVLAPVDRALARLAAAQVGVAARLEGAGRSTAREGRGVATLELLGEALAAGADETETAEHVVRLAAEAIGAAGATLWRIEVDGPPSYLAAHGFDSEVPDLASAAEAAGRAVRERRYLTTRAEAGWDGSVATIPLGEPPVGALQLYFEGDGPGTGEMALLAPFAARTALALRRSRRVGLIATALRRSQTVIGVVSQAIAQLSLAHTLETAVERIAELTASGHVAVYLREGERLTAAASRGLSGAHTDLAERLLELALGPFRGRGFLFIEDLARDPRVSGLERVLEETRVRRAIFVPLIVHDEVTGALAVFKTRPRPYREGEEGLLLALSSQLAVAVQNARLHERTKELGSVLERTLASERRAARQLRGLYEVSHSFAESLSLDATLAAFVKTMVELFDVDAAAIRMPAPGGDELAVRAVHVADERLREAAPAILSRPQPLGAPLAQRLLRLRQPVLLVPGTSGEFDAHRVLEPFLQHGSSAAVLPLATAGEFLGTLTLLSLDPARPLEKDTVDAAMTVVRQAALALDNARLYQEQRHLLEAMQRSLLPRELPAVPGIEVGHVYESSADVEVGGDVYDFVLLDDGRLAVFLGDVTGKGIEAAADMAMAKFSFRALARQNPEPGALLAAANEVVVEEIATGKFITMLCFVVDPRTRDAACATAGHPPGRVVGTDGTVLAFAARGLALGIDTDQEYPEERLRLSPGETVVLFTDGVIEARRGGELYGEERLDAFLSAHAGLGAQELAEAIVADCRAFAGGDLADDCATVCLRLLG